MRLKVAGKQLKKTKNKKQKKKKTEGLQQPPLL